MSHGAVSSVQRIPPTKVNKLIQYEISSSAVQANSSHAWVHKKGDRVLNLPLSLVHTGLAYSVSLVVEKKLNIFSETLK